MKKQDQVMYKIRIGALLIASIGFLIGLMFEPKTFQNILGSFMVSGISALWVYETFKEYMAALNALPTVPTEEEMFRTEVNQIATDLINQNITRQQAVYFIWCVHNKFK
jgi:hypothetical protein